MEYKTEQTDNKPNPGIDFLSDFTSNFLSDVTLFIFILLITFLYKRVGMWRHQILTSQLPNKERVIVQALNTLKGLLKSDRVLVLALHNGSKVLTGQDFIRYTLIRDLHNEGLVPVTTPPEDQKVGYGYTSQPLQNRPIEEIFELIVGAEYFRYRATDEIESIPIRRFLLTNQVESIAFIQLKDTTGPIIIAGFPNSSDAQESLKSVRSVPETQDNLGQLTKTLTGLLTRA